MIKEDHTLKSYFSEKTKEAISNLSIDINSHTEVYVVDTLSKANKVNLEYIGFDKPAALILSEDVFEDTTKYKSLGDATLISLAVFRKSLKDKPVDLDYYVAIGQNSYKKFLNVMGNTPSIFSEIYKELTSNFRVLTDAISDEVELGKRY